MKCFLAFLPILIGLMYTCAAPAPAITVDQGKLRLRDILFATHQTVAPTRPLAPCLDIGPSECRTFAGASMGTFLTTIGFDIRLTEPDGAGLLPAIEAYWRQMGYRVNTKRLHHLQPELLAYIEGLGVIKALAVPGSWIAYLGAETTCLLPNVSGK